MKQIAARLWSRKVPLVAVATCLIGGIAGVGPSQAATSAIVISPTSTQDARNTPPLLRPVMQALSQYRSGNTTAVQLASVIPVPGAARYRLERLGESSRWVFVGECERVCRVSLDNAKETGTVRYRMRAVAPNGDLSLPSVDIGVTPHQWKSKKHPGARFEARLGPNSVGILAKAMDDALVRLTPVCVVDEALRFALSQAASQTYMGAAQMPSAGTVAAGLTAYFTDWFYKSVYNGKCDLLKGVAASVLNTVRQVESRRTALFSMESYWGGQHESSAPDLWICHVSVGPKGGLVQPFYRIDTSESPCLNFANFFWFVAGAP